MEAVNFTRPGLAMPLSRLLRHLLPSGSCLLCADASGDALVCADCTDDLPRLDALRCPHCALPVHRAGPCTACLHSTPHFDAVHASFRYDFPVDRLIHLLKYGHRPLVARWLGEQLAALPDCQDLPQAAWLMPIPLHPARLSERGFNQSLEIARQVARLTGRTLHASGLRRTRATSPQAALSHAERARNVAGAFECDHDLDGRTILLVDDVMTTGDTVNEAARILKIHGAARVSVLVAARAVRHGRDDESA